MKKPLSLQINLIRNIRPRSGEQLSFSELSDALVHYRWSEKALLTLHFAQGDMGLLCILHWQQWPNALQLRPDRISESVV